MRALRDDTQEVMVETINARPIGYNSVVSEEKPQIPTKKDKFVIANVKKRNNKINILISKQYFFIFFLL